MFYNKTRQTDRSEQPPVQMLLRELHLWLDPNSQMGQRTLCQCQTLHLPGDSRHLPDLPSPQTTLCLFRPAAQVETSPAITAHWPNKKIESPPIPTLYVSMKMYLRRQGYTIFYGLMFFIFNLTFYFLTFLVCIYGMYLLFYISVPTNQRVAYSLFRGGV